MKRLLIYMVCSVLFSGCSPEDRALPPAPDAIRFVSGISVEVSKATGPVSGTVLQSGSRIGLFAASGGSGGGGGTVVMNNLVGTVEAEGAINYDPVKYYEKDKEYNFYACYPYTVSDYTDAEKAPLLSVSLAPNAQAQDDYLWSSLPGVTPEAGGTTGVRKFAFRHALCQVRVRIWNGSDKEVSLNSITLKAPGSGVLSLGDGTWSEANETKTNTFTSFTLFSPTKLLPLPEEAFYEVPAALLQLPVSEEVMKSQVFSITIEGKTYEVKPTTPAGGWKAGFSYLYTVWYATDGIGFQGTVESWEPVDGGNVDTGET